MPKTLAETMVNTTLGVKPDETVLIDTWQHTLPLASQLAFQVCLQVLQKDGEKEILPVLWDDNYVTLMPGESRVISASFEPSQLQRVQPELKVSGWNIVPQTKLIATAAVRSRKKK